MNKLGVIIMVFIIAIVGTAFLTTIADSTSDITNDVDIVNETLALPAGLFNDTDVNTTMVLNLTNNDWVDNTVVIYKSTGVALNTSEYAVNYTSEGITFLNASDIYNITTTNNNTGVNYSYYSSNYVDNASSRVLVGLLPLFFVLILVIAILDKIMGGELIGLFKRS